jgi:hypothetical protein
MLNGFVAAAISERSVKIDAHSVPPKRASVRLDDLAFWGGSQSTDNAECTGHNLNTNMHSFKFWPCLRPRI